MVIVGNTLTTLASMAHIKDLGFFLFQVISGPVQVCGSHMDPSIYSDHSPVLVDWGEGGGGVMFSQVG